MRLTKKELEKENAALKKEIEDLKKENAALIAKVQFYESLPAQAGKVCTDVWCGLVNFVAGQGQQNEKKEK